MADVEKTVAIIFSGDDKVSKTITSISEQLSDLSNIGENIANPFAKVADGILKVDAALSALAIGGMALAIREAGKFNGSFSEITTLFKATSEETDRFRRDLLEYSKDSTQSIDSINKSVYTAISSGIDYKNSLDLISTAEKLAVGGKADLEKTILTLVSTLNSYGVTTKEATKYSDILFKTVELGQTTIPELSASLAQVTPIAAGLKIPFETLTAAIAAITAKGLPTSEAITGIKAAIDNIINPSKDAIEQAQRLGISFNGAALQAKGFDNILFEIAQKTGGNAVEIKKLFGSTEAYNSVLALTSNNAKIFKADLEAMNNAAGSTIAAFEKMVNNFEYVNNRLSNIFKVVGIDLGSKMLEPYSNVVDGIGEVLKSLDKSINAGTFDPLFREVENFSKKMSEFFKEVAKALPEALSKVDFSGLIKAFGEVGKTLASFFDNLDLTKPDDLAKVIQGVTDTIESLIYVTDGIIEQFKPLWESIKEGISRFNTLDKESQTTFGNFLGSAKMVIDAGLAVAAAILTIQKTGIQVGRVFDVIIGSVKGVFNTLQMTFDTIALNILKGVDLILAGIQKVSWGNFNKGVQESRDELGKWKLAIEETRLDNANDLINAGQQAWKGITGEVEKATKAINEVPNAKSIEAKATFDEQFNKLLETEKQKKLAKDIFVNANTSDAQGKIDKLQKPVNTKVVPLFEVDKNSLEKLKIQSELVQKGMEWKAKIDISQIEASTTKMKEAFNSINLGLQTSSNEIIGIASEYANLGNSEADIKKRSFLSTMMARASLQKQQEIDLQEKLINAQIREIDAKTRTLESGDGMIKITAEGLEPELEAFMFKIIQKVQIRANESSAEFLLGISA